MNPKNTTPQSILVSWIGQTDLDVAKGDPGAGIGPIAQAAAFKLFARLVLLSNYPVSRSAVGDGDSGGAIP
jgi:hypothetical protein